MPDQFWLAPLGFRSMTLQDVIVKMVLKVRKTYQCDSGGENWNLSLEGLNFGAAPVGRRL
jgi:hypothetical protein